jgi:hypothetical protein
MKILSKSSIVATLSFCLIVSALGAKVSFNGQQANLYEANQDGLS